MTSSMQSSLLFTSSLQMWSPSTSLLFLSNHTMTSATTCGSRLYYHHDPMLYHETACCMICGLHHSVPYTAMEDTNDQSAKPYKPMITPAPVIILNQQPPLPRHRQFDTLSSQTKSFSPLSIKRFLLKLARDFAKLVKKKASLAVSRKSSLIYPVMIRKHHRSRLEKHAA